MAGNPWLAFGAGVAGGIESAQNAKTVRQQKIDDMYRERAIQTQFELEEYRAKKQLDKEQSDQALQDMENIAGVEKFNTVKEQTYNVLKQSQSEGIENAPPPTNTPQVNTSNLPPIVTTNPNAQLQTPEQGDATNPLTPPQAQEDAIDLDSGKIVPVEDDNLVEDKFGNKITVQQRRRALAIGQAENKKLGFALSGEAAYMLGVNEVLKQDKSLTKEGLFESVEDAKTRAQAYGVPFVPDKQFLKLSVDQQEKRYAADRKAFDKEYNGSVPALDTKIATLSRLMGLNDVVTTGGIYALPGVADFRASVDANAAEFQKLQATLALNAKPANYGGSISNFELQMFGKANPNFGIPNEANYVIAAFMLGEAQRRKDQLAFKDAMLDANYHATPALTNAMWAKYIEDNPLFDPASPDVPMVNKNVVSWQEYFAGRSPDEILSSTSKPATAPQQAPNVIGTWNPETGQIE